MNCTHYYNPLGNRGSVIWFAAMQLEFITFYQPKSIVIAVAM